MSKLIPFKFNTKSIRVITKDDGENWFVAKDVAEALGYANTASAIMAHCKKSKTAQECKVCDSHTLHPQTKLIPESDVYRLAMKSELPTAEPFQDWLADEVIPSIRKTGVYTISANPVLPPIHEAMLAVEVIARVMRLPESGTLMLFNSTNKRYGSPMELPVYAIDAPPSEVTKGSSMSVSSATELLKEHDAGISAIAFNRLLESQGFIETLTRKSSGTKPKQYKSVTKKGLEFGKNVTTPNNPKETQPLWYDEKFSDLLDVVLVEA